MGITFRRIVVNHIQYEKLATSIDALIFCVPAATVVTEYPGQYAGNKKLPPHSF
jgi:hypothetical protein